MRCRFGGMHDVGIWARTAVFGRASRLRTGLFAAMGVDALSSSPRAFRHVRKGLVSSVTGLGAKCAKFPNRLLAGVFLLALGGFSQAALAQATPSFIADRDSIDLHERGSAGTLNFRLAAFPTTTVTVTVTSSDPGAVAVSPEALTFDTQNWFHTQAVTVTPLSDGDTDDENLVVTLSASGGNYDGVSTSIPVTVTDDVGFRTTSPTNVRAGSTSGGVDVTWDWADDTGGVCHQNLIADRALPGFTVEYRKVTVPEIAWVTPGHLDRNTADRGAFETYIVSSLTINSATTGRRPEQDGVTLDHNSQYEVRVSAYSTACEDSPNEPNSRYVSAKGTPLPFSTATLALSDTSISEAGGMATITASLTAALGVESTITVTATPGSPAVVDDFEISDNRTLTFGPTSTTSTGTVTITAVDNDVYAPGKTVTVAGTASNGVMMTGVKTLTIDEDDRAGLTFFRGIAVAERGRRCREFHRVAFE